MQIFGIRLKQINGQDWLSIGAATLIGLLLLYPLANLVGTRVVFGWAFAGFSGAILSAMGVSIKHGWKHAVPYFLITIPMYFIGNGVWWILAGLFDKS